MTSRVLLALALLAGGAVVAPRADAASFDDFGRCLAREGAVFYGASWCPHCRAQRLTLGDAMAHVRYVECAVAGSRESAPACDAAHVTGYPTWIFADGSRASGEQSIAHLAAKTGCTPPTGSAGGAPPPPARSAPAAQPARGGNAPYGHAKIIEVPD